MGVTVSIADFHLLDGRDVFVVLGVKGLQGMEHFIDRAQEVPQVLVALLETSLHSGEVVVNTNVMVS